MLKAKSRRSKPVVSAPARSAAGFPLWPCPRPGCKGQFEWRGADSPVVCPRCLAKLEAVLEFEKLGLEREVPM